MEVSPAPIRGRRLTRLRPRAPPAPFLPDADPQARPERATSVRPSRQRPQYQSPSRTAESGRGKHSRCQPAPHPSHRSIRAAPVDRWHLVQAKSRDGTAVRGSTRPSTSALWHGAHCSMCTCTVLLSDPSSSNTPFAATVLTRSIGPRPRI
jgi:hypothetical protein